MLIVACLFAAGPLMAGAPSTAPSGDSVKVVRTADLRHGGPHLASSPLPRNARVWPKLSHREIQAITIKDGPGPNAGVTDFLHLDARTPFALGKGSLSFVRCWTDMDSNYAAFDIQNGGGATLTFQAQSAAAIYIVDFQLSLGPQPFSMQSTVDGGYQETAVDGNTHHMLYVVNCTGGTHKIEVYATIPCVAMITGVDVTLVK